ncbi:iron-containing alcohol dehydrogenase [Collinsella sp. zg1085]|nr:iron-containing alcohol dehydrogenase [Collinsella sp. zg1085]
MYAQGHTFTMPSVIQYGEGALQQAKECLRAIGTTALIVTGETLVRLGSVSLVIDLLAEIGIKSHIFAEVNDEPTDELVRVGVAVYQSHACDCIVGIGGGSSLDTMKAIALMASTGLDIADPKITHSFVQPCNMVAIPTTAGTGSEATQFTIIRDTQHEVKMLIAHERLIPNIAIVDPVFSSTAPALVTAATGLDALCHAVESYTSKNAQPLSKTYSLSATRRIFTYLPQCILEPDNKKARTEMSVAALEAGIALNNAGVTLIHGMSRPLGAYFHVPHGFSNAMLMEPCLQFVQEAAKDRFAEIARYCGLTEDKHDDQGAADFQAAVHELIHALPVPSMSEYGIEHAKLEELLDIMVSDALASGSPANTIREVTAADIKALYQSAYS